MGLYNQKKEPIRRYYLTLKLITMKNSFFKLTVLLFFLASSLFDSLLSQYNTFAVLVVGTHSSGTSSVNSLDKTGEFLESKGIKTYKFYKEKSDWEAIKRAAKNAHFFVYSGHGSNKGKTVLVD